MIRHGGLLRVFSFTRLLRRSGHAYSRIHIIRGVEYCSPMWSPNHVKDIVKLERVQRQASKFILNEYVSPYHKRCTALSILPLCFRREIIDLCFLFLQSNIAYVVLLSIFRLRDGYMS